MTDTVLASAGQGRAAPIVTVLNAHAWKCGVGRRNAAGVGDAHAQREAGGDGYVALQRSEVNAPLFHTFI